MIGGKWRRESLFLLRGSWERLQECLCKDFQGNVRGAKGMQGYIGVYKGVQGYIRFYKCIQGFTGLFKGLHGYI